jgi:hypothetical protein
MCFCLLFMETLPHVSECSYITTCIWIQFKSFSLCFCSMPCGRGKIACILQLDTTEVTGMLHTLAALPLIELPYTYSLCIFSRPTDGMSRGLEWVDHQVTVGPVDKEWLLLKTSKCLPACLSVQCETLNVNMSGQTNNSLACFTYFKKAASSLCRM